MMSLPVWPGEGGVCPREGLCLERSLSQVRGGSVQGGLCLWGSVSRGVSVQGFSIQGAVRGVSVQGDLCLGGLCPGVFVHGDPPLR